MRKEYKEELEALRIQMEKAEDFANKVPLFKEKILKAKLTGDEPWVNFTDRYKTMDFRWGLGRGRFDSKGGRTITNLNEEYDLYCWRLYINSVSLFGSLPGEILQEPYNNLHEIHKQTGVYFYDSLNTTFYCTDYEIENLLEAIYAWYIKSQEHVSMNRDKRRLEEIKKEIEEKEKELKELQEATK